MDGENRIWFHHRLGGMIKTSGANVSPEEVEFALRTIGGVIECAAFPVADARAGQIVAAAIVRDETAEINEASIQRDLRPLLSSFKIPKIIRFVERLALPRTPSDKIRRAEVARLRSEEQTSELQSLMRNSYAVFCLKKKRMNNSKPTC